MYTEVHLLELVDAWDRLNHARQLLLVMYALDLVAAQRLEDAE